MPQHNLPTNCSPSRGRGNHSNDYPRGAFQFQGGTYLGGSSKLPTNHSLNGVRRNIPHQQQPGQRMTEMYRQRTGNSPGTTRPSYAQIAQQGHNLANAQGATNWARDDLARLDNYTSIGDGYLSLEPFFDTHSYYNGDSSTLPSREEFSHSHQERTPPEPTGLHIPGGITSHEPPWSIMNQRADQGPTTSQSQGLQRLGFDPSDPSASTKTTTTTASTSIQCPYCSACFTGKHGKGNLGRHKRQIHVSGPQSFKCERGCERSYARKDARLKHYKKHHQEQGYYLSGLTNP